MTPRPGLSHAKILTAAESQSALKGPMGYTMADLAGELTVRSPTLYHYFSGLDVLRDELARHGLEELNTVLSESIMGYSGSAALLQLAQALRRFAHERKGLYLAVQRPPSRDNKPWFGAGMKVLATFYRSLTLMGFSDVEARHAVRSLRSAVHGFVLLEIEGQFGPEEDLDESFARLVGAVVSDIAARAKCSTSMQDSSEESGLAK